jgi:hypothetical protein
MNFSNFPSSVRINALLLQCHLNELELEGTFKITATSVEYEERFKRNHADEINEKIPLLISDLRNESVDLTPLPDPFGDNWEDQVINACNEINQISTNTRNDDQLKHYYQLGSLLAQRDFSTEAKDFTKTYLLSNRIPGSSLIAQRVYTLYSTRGTWNIKETKNITCYVLRYINEVDFQGVLLPEAADAKIRELFDYSPDF